MDTTAYGNSAASFYTCPRGDGYATANSHINANGGTDSHRDSHRDSYCNSHRNSYGDSYCDTN
jgi:hypothetical protein